MNLLWALKNNRGCLRRQSFKKRAFSPQYLILFYLRIQNIIFYLKESDFMEGLSKIPRLLFVFPKPFHWLQVIFFPWGWGIQRHQVRKIRLSTLLKLLELTLCKGQNTYTWKMKTAIEWFPGPTNVVGVSGSEGAKDSMFEIICVHRAFVVQWLPVLRKIRDMES